MKKSLLLVFAVAATIILSAGLISFPTRFRLQSNSPSGRIQVEGLRYEGRNFHALDGTLRLFVSHDGSELKQQTSIPWGRDLKIRWEAGNGGEAFVVEKNRRALMKFEVRNSNLKCIKGEEFLAEDPYRKTKQIDSP